MKLQEIFTLRLMRYFHTCFNCGHSGQIKEFYDGHWKQGNETYMVIRCPKCFHHNGRLCLNESYTEATMETALLSFLRFGRKFNSAI